MELYQNMNGEGETEGTAYEFTARAGRKAPSVRRPQPSKSRRPSPQSVNGIHRRRTKRIVW